MCLDRCRSWISIFSPDCGTLCKGHLVMCEVKVREWLHDHVGYPEGETVSSVWWLWVEVWVDFPDSQLDNLPFPFLLVILFERLLKQQPSSYQLPRVAPSRSSQKSQPAWSVAQICNGNSTSLEIKTSATTINYINLYFVQVIQSIFTADTLSDVSGVI